MDSVFFQMFIALNSSFQKKKKKKKKKKTFHNVFNMLYPWQIWGRIISEQLF